MSVKDWFALVLVTAASFFILAGAGIFTFWFWLQVF